MVSWRLQNWFAVIWSDIGHPFASRSNAPFTDQSGPIYSKRLLYPFPSSFSNAQMEREYEYNAIISPAHGGEGEGEPPSLLYPILEPTHFLLQSLIPSSISPLPKSVEEVISKFRTQIPYITLCNCLRPPLLFQSHFLGVILDSRCKLRQINNKSAIFSFSAAGFVAFSIFSIVNKKEWRRNLLAMTKGGPWRSQRRKAAFLWIAYCRGRSVPATTRRRRRRLGRSPTTTIDVGFF